MKGQTRDKSKFVTKFVGIIVAMSTLVPILLVNFLPAMAAGHTEDFQVYVLE